MLQYQTPNGTPNFQALLKIPVSDRVPGLAAKYGEEKIHAIVVIMLKDFLSTFNLVRPMSPDQIVTCAYEMMFSTREDFLSLEDLAMFFKQAKEGTFGKAYEGLDQPKIFEMFEQYRQSRHETFLESKYEQDQQHKTLPVNDRIADMFTSERDKMREATIEEMKRTNAA